MWGTGLKTVRKVGDVLRLFTTTNPQHSSSEIAKALGVSPSSAHELIHSLAEIGLLHKVSPGKFRLGKLAVSLARVFEDTDPLFDAAHPVVSEFSKTYGETAQVAALQGDRLVILAEREGDHPVRVAAKVVGPESPLYAVAPGKLLLAHMAMAALERLLKSTTFVQFTGFTVRSPSYLLTELSKAMEQGIAVADKEYVADLTTLATPIRNHAGSVVAAFGLALPASRYAAQPRALQGIAVEAARRVSARLGYVEASSRVRRPASAST